MLEQHDCAELAGTACFAKVDQTKAGEENMKKVSVIVPIYKAAAYLPECVDSLIAQTYQNLEILLIDDGSPDESGAIADAYAAKDPRIKVFHKENGGVSSARNLGIQNATGEYIAFVDSDDHVVPNMYELLMAAADKYDADQACCNINNIYADHIKQECHAFGNRVLFDEEIYKELTCSLLLPEAAKKASLLQSPCNKLYRRSIITENEILFVTGINYGEDWLFNVNFYRYARCVAFICEHLYNYNRVTEGSLSKKVRWDGFDQSVRLRSMEREWYPELRTEAEFHNLILSIQSHYLSMYANRCGYKGFAKYARSLFDNEYLQATYRSAADIQYKYKVPRFCIQYPNSSFHRGLYQIWAVMHVAIDAVKYYVKMILGMFRK